MPFSIQPPSPNGDAAERRFLAYVTLIGAVLLFMVALEVCDRVGAISGAFEQFAYPSEIALDVLLFALIAGAAPKYIGEMRRRNALATAAYDARSSIELLFKMTEMLQSAHGRSDANAVLRSTASSLMPGFGGALYVFNNSGDRLELSTSWAWPGTAALADAIAPSDCWAIKRGKLHLNLADTAAPCCDHHPAGLVTMEIPMMARGEIYGLLLVERAGEAAPTELRTVASVATALADAMSLSLSNLALRERLRTQALRDGLTGLYNRRYLEDALERGADQANRAKSPLSLVMIDLDHFKKLNDEHGHAMGDAVLVDVAGAILGAIRPCDVACRYGGEELVVLLPDCGLDEAVAKAEVLRGRIERLSERHGVQLSASFGVASSPETSKPKALMSDADGALYQSKQAGRNRVTAAARAVRDIATPPATKAA